jgi:hypothetical protein
MNDHELNRERRRQRALERLGTSPPRCGVCGYDDPLALELHHIAGRTYGGELVPVCRNCHRRLSDMHMDHPADVTTPPGDLERIGHFLLGLADLFELLVKHIREFATKLFAIDREGQARGGEDGGD